MTYIPCMFYRVGKSASPHAKRYLITAHYELLVIVVVVVVVVAVCLSAQG